LQGFEHKSLEYSLNFRIQAEVDVPCPLMLLSEVLSSEGEIKNQALAGRSKKKWLRATGPVERHNWELSSRGKASIPVPSRRRQARGSRRLPNSRPSENDQRRNSVPSEALQLYLVSRERDISGWD